MNFIDTHTHLFTDEFNNDRKEILLSALHQGVQQFYLPSIDSGSFQSMLSTREIFPENIFLMAGLHPCSVKENYQKELDLIEKFMQTNDFIGIGETGLDFFWDKTFVNQQIESLQHHIQWALHYHKPIILHTRNSTPKAIEIVSKYAGKGLTGIFHCFSGTVEEAKQIIDCGFYLGIGGVVTFKNSGLDQVVEQLDLKHLVLETDSPYLAPVPYRGKRNQSAYLPIIAQKIAAIKNLPLEEVAEVTTKNALTVFQNTLNK